MLSRLAEAIEVVDMDDVTDDQIILEDCGEIDERLDGFCVVLPESNIGKLQEIYDEVDPQNSNHVELILNNRRGPVIIYTAITNQFGEMITEYGLENCGEDVDAFLETYGGNAEPRQVSTSGRSARGMHYGNFRVNNEEPDYSDYQPRNYSDRDYQQVEEVVEYEKQSYNEPVAENEDEDDDDDVFNPEDFKLMLNVVISKDPSKSAYIKQIENIYNKGDIVTGSKLLITVLDELDAKGLI